MRILWTRWAAGALAVILVLFVVLSLSGTVTLWQLATEAGPEMESAYGRHLGRAAIWWIFAGVGAWKSGRYALQGSREEEASSSVPSAS